MRTPRQLIPTPAIETDTRLEKNTQLQIKRRIHYPATAYMSRGYPKQSTSNSGEMTPQSAHNHVSSTRTPVSLQHSKFYIYIKNMVYMVFFSERRRGYSQTGKHKSNSE